MKENWKYKRVNEVCEKASSNIVLNKIENNNGEYALYGASGFVKGIDFYHREEPYIGIVKDGSGVGRVDVYPAKSSLVGTMQYILPKNDCLLKYLCYALQGLKLSKFITGAAIPHIYFRDYGQCKIPIPTLTEQKQIISELDLLQSIIDKQQAQLKELDNLAQAIFFDMFGDPVENEKEWEVKRLGDLCDVYRGGSPRPIEQYLGGTIPWIKIGDATKGDDIYLHQTKEHIIEEGLNKTRYIHSGSLIFANCGVSLGFARIITFNGCIHDGWLAFDNISNEIEKVFLLKSLNFCTQYFRSIAPDGTQPNLNTSIMKSFKQIIPPLSIQKEYIEKIDGIEKQKTLISQSLAESQKLFDYTMDKYFG